MCARHPMPQILLGSPCLVRPRAIKCWVPFNMSQHVLVVILLESSRRSNPASCRESLRAVEYKFIYIWLYQPGVYPAQHLGFQQFFIPRTASPRSREIYRLQFPTLCVALGIRLPPGGELSYTRNVQDVMNTDRRISLRANLISADIPKTTMMTVEWYIDDDNCDHNCTEVDIFFDAQSGSRYNAQIFAFAQDRLTNESVSGLKITADVESEDPAYLEDVKPGNRVIDVIVTIRRSTLVIVYCLVITLTIWLVTLMICCIMIATVMFGFRQRNEIVVVPVATLFAFTQLRSLMPGAPGGFDFAGLLPCLVLLSISAVTMVGIYLFVNPDDPARRPFTIGDIGYMLRYYMLRTSAMPMDMA
ncbi:hypothetical protein EV421DRAFT_1742848 [Armillaria borealis]|uniref:Uncharacterized protein n=1 Tax=Armillaria borealis TaxID=47425 RepID=A0AA39IXP1_9AGAR|nr:hypothetical protein EV421DRAFT_1742848 [Armillaria borealis]